MSDPHSVHDLPQLYSHPSFEALATALDLLKIQPGTFSTSAIPRRTYKVDPSGVPRYLTSIIASSLSWLSDEEARERIWDQASARLSERSGRSAMPSMHRSFYINPQLTIKLFEPSLTEDHLGLKTWTSSLLLAKRLPTLRSHFPSGCPTILELGSGTGLVGIAAACLWNVDVVLTDLSDIVPNLQRNVETNSHLFTGQARHLRARPLDWSDPLDCPEDVAARFTVILAADPIYSPDHPGFLVDAVTRWLVQRPEARFIVELPLRRGYEKERTDLRQKLCYAGMEVIEEGVEIGYDDWEGADGNPAEVECSWSVWRPSH